ncbi:UNVERIFIED_CONTAM: hypothetical protein NCL1_50602 [Trichonephila clavipes]
MELNVEEMQLQTFIKMPKINAFLNQVIELHAHLNGSLSHRTLQKLIDRKKTKSGRMSENCWCQNPSNNDFSWNFLTVSWVLTKWLLSKKISNEKDYSENPLSQIALSRFMIQQQYSQNESQVFTPSTVLRHNYRCLKFMYIKDYSQAIALFTAEVITYRFNNQSKLTDR